MHLKKTFDKPFTILLLTLLHFATNVAQASNYYFSTSRGNDSRNSSQAQTPATPWKTIAKLNSFFGNLHAGDSVLFKRGEIFYGAVIITKSGSSSLPIVLGSYGRGNKPVISGLALLSSWSSSGGGIYQSRCSLCKQATKMLLINGVQQALGRYPNTSYLTYGSHTGNTSITDSQLIDSANWTGADVVIRKKRWIIDRSAITAQNGNTLNYASGTLDAPTDCFFFFFLKRLQDTRPVW
jgi:hypothetical protein